MTPGCLVRVNSKRIAFLEAEPHPVSTAASKSPEGAEHPHVALSTRTQHQLLLCIPFSSTEARELSCLFI